MAGITALRRVQIGAETTKGTLVAATTPLRVKALLNDQRTMEMIEEDIGIRGGVGRSNVPALLMALEIASSPITFEQFDYILQSGIKKVDGVQDGLGSGYVRTYDVSPSTLYDFQTYSIEAGNNQERYAAAYAFTTTFKITGESRQALQFTATMQGRQEESLANYAAVAIPEVEEVNFGRGTFYLDDSTVGTTQISSTLMMMELEVTTGLVAMFTGDGGQLYFDHVSSTVPEISLGLTYLHNGTGEAERAKWKNEEKRLIRMNFDGAPLQTPETETTKRLTIDLAGKYTEWEALDQIDNNDVVKCTLTSFSDLDSTPDLFCTFQTVNELATLP